jgi:hypothetical protein
LVRSRITRRELLRQAGATGALALGYPALAGAEGAQNQQTAPPIAGPGPKPESQAAEEYAHPPGVFINRPLTQVSKAADALLDDMEGRNCDFFWNEASPRTGLVRDRAPWTGRSLSRVASIAATGFGLSGLCIAAKRNYLRPSDCEARAELTLAFLLEECPHEHGFLYHFIDIESGQRLFGSELSSIDTALLLCGVLHCRQYFTGNSRVQALATTFYRRIDWQWMMNGGKTLSMGWLPDQGFLNHRWDIYSELTTMYLMAIGSPTHPAPPETWESVQRPIVSYGGIDYISGVAPLFIHQYSQAWCDYRDVRDRHANYFTNSIAATRAHQLWCLVLGQKFPWIDQDMWGISASDSRQGYRVWGGPPSMGPLDGTLVPCATAGSLAFLPAECTHVLLTMRERYGDKLYGRYGFADAFQPRAGWFGDDVIGIDVGIGLLMAENLRSGFVWEYFMKNREIAHAMREVAFHPDPDVNSQVL